MTLTFTQNIWNGLWDLMGYQRVCDSFCSMQFYLKLAAAFELEAHLHYTRTLPAVSSISWYTYHPSGHFYLQSWAEDQGKLFFTW